MRYILIILVFLSVGANAQMVIKAHANYRPYASPSVNLLLDDYPNAAAAYSLRKLDKDYTGAAIRVRRSNDNAESDIGFTSSGDLDTAALKTFVGANNGFVVTWYDQSGNGSNATQSTAANQPRVVNAGVIERKNSKPTCLFDGNNDNLALATAVSISNQSFFVALNHTNNITNTSGAMFLWRSDRNDGSPPTNNLDLFGFGGDFTGSLTNERISWIYIFSGLGVVGVGQTSNNINAGSYIYSAIHALTPSTYIHQNNTQLTLTNATGGSSSGFTATRYPAQFNRIGNSSDSYNGSIFEFILYPSDETTNRSAITSNINTHYGIY